MEGKRSFYTYITEDRERGANGLQKNPSDFHPLTSTYTQKNPLRNSKIFLGHVM